MEQIGKISSFFVRIPPVFAYYSAFILRATWRDVLFCVADVECYAATSIEGISSALLDVPFGLLKEFRVVSNIVSEGVLLSIAYGAREFVDAVGYIQIIFQFF